MMVKTSAIMLPDVFTRVRAGLKKPVGLEPPLEPPLYAISKSNWSPESAEVRPPFQSVS